jgi:4-amino-4-deoxy-L-arabinose transferase-like glycosyltransferase
VETGLMVDDRAGAEAPVSSPGYDWLLVGLLTALGVGLRLAYLVRVPPFLDEYSSMLAGLSILRTGGIPELPSRVLYPSGSLFSYLEALFFQLFGFSDAVARLPSLLIAALTLPLLYLLARKLLNRRVALWSVALLAILPEAVVWGARARMYALLQLLVLLASYFFYRSVLDRRSQGKPAPAWPWIVCFLAAIFAQDEAILLLPLLWLAAGIARGPRWFLRPTVLLGQVLVPLAGVGLRFWLNEIRVPGEVYTLTHDSFFRFPPALAHGLRQVAPFFLAPEMGLVSLFFGLALFFVAYDLIKRVQLGQAAGELGGWLSELFSQPAVFLAYLVLAVAAAIVLVVNTPWQDDRYLFMLLPHFLLVATYGLDRLLGLLARRLPGLRSELATGLLLLAIALLALPAGLSALRRYEPDYSAAYRWLRPQLADDHLVATMRPAPAAVYLGRADYLVAEDRHQEFIMRLDGEWVDRWVGAHVVESPAAFRDEVLRSGQVVWFVIDEDRFESVAYSPEFVGLNLVYRDGGVLVFRGQGYQPPPPMAVQRNLDANFDDQLRLVGYSLSSDQPQPGDEIVLRLHWQALQPDRNYTVFVHLVGAGGQGLAQIDGEPFLGLYGMSTHWPRDRVVVDERRLELPAGTPPGRYRLEVGLYDPDDPDLDPLPLLDAAGNEGGRSLTLDYLRVNVPPPPQPAQLVSEGNLGDQVRLLGYTPSLAEPVAAGTVLPLTLTWECLAPMDADYTVFVHLVGAEPQPVAQADGPPLGGDYPTSFWRVGERLADRHELELPAGLAAGEYDLLVGMYLLGTDERLPWLDAAGQVVGDAVPLGAVRIGSP